MSIDKRPVLGIDPGSEYLGLCLLRPGASKPDRVWAVHMKGRLHFRFGWLLDELEPLLREHTKKGPLECAVEIPLVWGGNYGTLALAGARGVVLACISRAGARLAEYHASKIKKAVTGKGNAKKWEVAAVMKRLLSIEEELPFDAFDAAALAYYHANRSRLFEESLEGGA